MMMMMMAVCISSTKKKKSFFVHEEFVFSQKTVQLSAPLFKFCSVDTNRQDLARFEKKKTINRIHFGEIEKTDLLY